MLRRIVVVLLLCAGGAAGAAVTLSQAEAASGGSAGWKRVSLPDEWERSFPRHSGTVEYKLAFDRPGTQSEPLAVYVQRACTNLAVYLNGELLGTGGKLEAPVTRNCYYPFLFSMPQAMVRATGNELRIVVAGFAAEEVSARQRAAGLSEVQVGPLEELQQAYESQRFLNITTAQIISTMIGGIGVAMLTLAAMRPRETYLLYFGFFTAGWALLGMRLFVRDVPLDNTTTEILICSAFPPVLGCAFQFLQRLVDRRHAWVDAFFVAQALVVPCVLVAVAPDGLLRAATAVYDLMALELLVSVAYFLRVAWRDYRREFWLMGAVLLIAVFLSALEIALQNNLLPLPKVHFIHYSMPFLMAVIGLRLIQQFVGALKRAETLNVELEERVAEKSREIENSWQQIASLRTAEATQRERQRIASDLHDDLGAQLLTIAQGSKRDPERIAAMARDALDEMRLSVRGMVGEAALLGDVIADWRAETVTRLTAAGFTVEWNSLVRDDRIVLPARTRVQLTRVLREAVSNTIRHSGGRLCSVRIAHDADQFGFAVEDDGRGMPAEPSRGGHGLANIERRIRALGGTHTWMRAPGGGTLLIVRVPLAEDPVTAGGS